tara:strand:+ start:233 stop:1669 length:1437 start_codon:yes stop_codon:yes gene_type:complete
MRKPKVRYYLDSLNNKGFGDKKIVMVSISAGFVLNIDGKKKYRPIRFSTEMSIIPDEFGDESTNYKLDHNKLRSTTKNQGLKNYMFKIEKEALELYYKYIEDGIYFEQFKKELQQKISDTKKEVEITYTLKKYLKEKILQFEKRIGTNSKSEIRENTIKVYRTLLRYILEYENVTKKVLTFTNFKETQFKDFWETQNKMLKGEIEFPAIKGYRKRTNKKDGFLSNSILKNQKSLLRILRLASREGHRVSLDFNDDNLLTLDTESSKLLYIDERDLSKVIEFKARCKNIKLAQHYVILASYMGLRYESMSELFLIQPQKSEKYDFWYVHSKQNKTRTECFVPVLKPVMDIYISNGNKFPKFKSNGAMNKLVKDFFEILNLNITSPVTKCFFDGKTDSRTYNIEEIISTHDFRSTFKSNLADKIDDMVVENILHPKRKRNSMTRIYDKRNMETKAYSFVERLNAVNSTNKPMKTYELYKD